MGQLVQIEVEVCPSHDFTSTPMRGENYEIGGAHASKNPISIYRGV